MPTENEVRQRAVPKSSPASGDKAAADAGKTSQPAASSGMSLLEVVRVLVALTVVASIASYLITRGESWVFGMQRPWWTKPKMIEAAMQPKIELTNEQLKAYDGSDPSKPLYLALNRTIYDVSSSPHIYGPGGPYHKLAAKDASRSYVTTCFDPEQDLVPYLGGVEEVFVPLWLSKNPSQKELDSIAKGDVMEGMGMKGLLDQIQKQIGRKKTRLMREAAYEEALDKVRAKIQTWEGMFAKKEYPVVGRVVGVDDADESKWKDLKLCDDALAQRPPLAESMSQVMKAAGSKDGKIDLGMMKKKKKQPGYPGFDASDVRRSEDKRKQEMAKAKRDDMKEDGKYGTRGSKKEEDAARSEERQRRREERKAEIAARKGIKPEDVSDQIADALKDTVVDE